jgi:hypothetical protein
MIIMIYGIMKKRFDFYWTVGDLSTNTRGSLKFKLFTLF